MTYIIKTYTTPKSAELIYAINNDENITPNCQQLISTGDGNSTFQFDNELTLTENNYLDSFLSSWIPPDDTLYVDTVIDSEDASSETIWSSKKVFDTIKNEFVGWKTLTSEIEVRTKDGSLSALHQEMGDTGFYGYIFPRNKEAWAKYHIDGDYKPNGEIYLQLHWTTDGTSTNNVKWQIKYTIAKGYNQTIGGEFFDPIHTVYMEQAASGIKWKHMITVSSLIELTNAEPSSMIMINLKRISGTGDHNNDDVFGLQLDLQYQTDRHSILNRMPNIIS